MPNCQHAKAIIMVSTALVKDNITTTQEQKERREEIKIKYCPDCQTLETTFMGEFTRLFPERVTQESDLENCTCPECSRMLVIDYKILIARCRHPLCNYWKRIPGLTKEAEERKIKFQEMNHAIYEATTKPGGYDAKDLPFSEEEYKRLKSLVRTDEIDSRSNRSSLRGDFKL